MLVHRSDSIFIYSFVYFPILNMFILFTWYNNGTNIQENDMKNINGVILFIIYETQFNIAINNFNNYSAINFLNKNKKTIVELCMKFFF